MLCDCATDSFGKLNVLGAFDRIYSARLPVVYPACAVAGRIRFDRSEEGKHKIMINIIDEDGGPIGPGKLEGGLGVKFRGKSDSAAVNFVLHFQRLTFKKFGEYRIDLSVDGCHETSLPLFVVEREQMHRQDEY